MNILELFARIGLKADQAPADAFLKTVKGIQGELVGAIAGTLSLAAAVKTMNAAMGQALEFKKFAAETGASAQELQKWAAVAENVSGSGDAVAASIKAIVSNQEAIKLGKGNISGYQLLGIDPRSDPFAVLEKLRSKLQGLSPAMRRNVAAQFGISPDLVMTLELTNEQFDKLAGRAWIIPQSSIEGLNRARAAITEVKNAFGFIRAELAAKFGPAIEQATKWVINFALMIERGVLMIDKIIRATIGWKAALGVIVGILALLNAQFLLSPIGLFTAAIVLLMAILEDLYVFSRGGKSLFGVLLEQSPAMAKGFKWLTDVVADFKELFALIKAGDLSGVQAMIDKWGILGDIINAIIDGIEWIIDSAKKVGQAVDEFMGGVKAGGLGQAAREAWRDEVMSDYMLPAPAGAVSGGTSTTSVAPVINIFGVTDPEAVGYAVTREMEAAMSAAKASATRAKGEY